jgi:AcrR family transcriptional regulator
MARPARYSAQGILDAAASLAAACGPANTTLAAIAANLGAPTGSIYHRFPSKDRLLAELWLQTVDSFQHGFQAALARPEPLTAGLQAALHTPRWVRANPRSARILLLHHRDDFVARDWPAELRARTLAQTRRSQRALHAFTRRALHSTSAPARRRIRLALVELPVASVLPHLRAEQPPPAILEQLIEDAYWGLIHGFGEPAKRSRPSRGTTSDNAASAGVLEG